MKYNFEQEDTDCPMGCSRNDQVIISGYDRIYNLPGNFKVVKCKTCGLVRTNPRPDLSSIGVYYPDNYGPYASLSPEKLESDFLVKSEFFDFSSYPKIFIKQTRKVFLNFHTTTLPNLKPGRLLEIGCASGTFLHEMASQGWKVEGVEFSQEAARKAKEMGYKVYEGQLEAISEIKGSFDLIVGWMVIEHLHNPIIGLRKLKEYATEDAWLVISVPNIDSFEFKIFKDKWYDLHLPNHLYHFRRETLERLLLAGGWKIEKVFYQRVLTSIIPSIGYILEEKGFKEMSINLKRFSEQSGPLISIFLYPIALLMSLFGKTGRMTVWARKSTS
jgi:2-polyprenyl-3-methyl-5-hydroxy-6-metoxy-1,4-benzoquinol methylase